MNSLNEAEISVLVEALRPLVGAKLQEVVVGSSGVGLGLWQENLSWIWAEMSTWFPMLVPLNRVPEKSHKPLRPLALFLRAHFSGRQLVDISNLSELGRAIALEFSLREGEEGPAVVEVHLWPHGQNVLARAQGKSVWFRKDQVRARVTSEPKAIRESKPARGVAELVREWSDWRAQSKNVAAPKSSPQRSELEQAQALLNQERVRVRRALGKVEADLKKKTENHWREVGELLLAQQNLALSQELSVYVDHRRSLAWNIEHVFAEAKRIERKIEASKERIETLRDELARLDRVANPEDFFAAQRRSEAAKAVVARNRGGGKNSNPKARFRTSQLMDGFEVWIGRGGRENLQLLRAAKPWYLWLHVRDEPGPHGIIPLSRGTNVNQAVLEAAGRELLLAQLGRRAEHAQGQVFTIQIAEVRFVRPIKGDTLGRVNFHSERVVRVRL